MLPLHWATRAALPRIHRPIVAGRDKLVTNVAAELLSELIQRQSALLLRLFAIELLGESRANDLSAAIVLPAREMPTQL